MAPKRPKEDTSIPKENAHQDVFQELLNSPETRKIVLKVILWDNKSGTEESLFSSFYPIIRI